MQNIYVRALRRAWADTSALMGFTSRGRVMLGLVLWALTVLVLWYMDWPWWLPGGADPGAEVKLGLSFVIAIIFVFFVLYTIQLCLAVMRIDEEQRNTINDFSERMRPRIAVSWNPSHCIAEKQFGNVVRAVGGNPSVNVNRKKKEYRLFCENLSHVSMCCDAFLVSGKHVDDNYKELLNDPQPLRWSTTDDNLVNGSTYIDPSVPQYLSFITQFGSGPPEIASTESVDNVIAFSRPGNYKLHIVIVSENVKQSDIDIDFYINKHDPNAENPRIIEIKNVSIIQSTS